MAGQEKGFRCSIAGAKVNISSDRLKPIVMSGHAAGMLWDPMTVCNGTSAHCPLAIAPTLSSRSNLPKSTMPDTTATNRVKSFPHLGMMSTVFLAFDGILAEVRSILGKSLREVSRRPVDATYPQFL